jgi:EAL domain-containing protein (putative c-di-GMP-specific phosphodiesterase class I)
MLNDLRSCGVRISIDDFGTGYSSLSYLKQLPVDEVKIDRSFVTDLAVSTADTSLVSAVVAIASSFGMSTVAEGVEDQEQNDRLIELGCKKAQGYLFSRPVPSVELPMAISRLGLSRERTPA